MIKFNTSPIASLGYLHQEITELLLESCVIAEIFLRRQICQKSKQLATVNFSEKLNYRGMRKFVLNYIQNQGRKHLSWRSNGHLF